MKRTLVALGVLGFVCVAALAQTEEAKPGEKLRMWDVWLGDWTWEENIKDSPSGSERKLEGAGQARKQGEFFHVWRGQWKDQQGKTGGGLFITGYDSVKKAYFVQGFRRNGWRGTASVTFGEKSVTEDYTGVTANGEETRHRCTYGFSEAENSQTCETFTDGKWWVSSKGKWTKVK